MGRCKFYKVEHIEIPINEAGSRSTHTTCDYAWCAHANSPVIEEVARNSGNGELRCNGNIDKCQLSPADIDIMRSKHY